MTVTDWLLGRNKKPKPAKRKQAQPRIKKPKQDGKNRTLRDAKPVPQRRADHDEKVVTSADALTGLQITQHTSVIAKINEMNGDCPAFYDDKGCLYTLRKTELERQENINLQALIKFIRSENLDIEFSYCTRNVFDTFMTQRVSTSSRDDEREGTAYVDDIFNRAVQSQATDIHIHVTGGKTRVQFRIYGALVDVEDFDATQGRKIINAIWNIYAKKQMSKNQSALDGRFTKKIQSRDWLVRVSHGNSPENDSESVAIRLRDMKDIPSLATLGYDESQLSDFKRAKGNKGVTLIVGSVNSGKSTTQTAIMADLPTDMVILEISDQIEVELPHVRQLQLPTQGVEDDIQKNRAELIKLPTRHDVDFLAINEIRDTLTASMLASMMMQGTAGITSIHGSKWGDAINRLLPGELEISPKVLFSDSFFNLIVFQTLVGILCQHCKQSECHDAYWDDHYRSGFGCKVANGMKFKRPGGCDKCAGSGIEGLTLIAEVIRIDQSNRHLLKDPDNSEPMTHWMRENNVLNVHQHARTKIAQGIIDPTVVRPKIGDFSKYNLFEEWHLT